MTENTTAIIVAIIGSGIITKLLDELIGAIKHRKNPMVAGIRFCLLKDLTDYGEGLLSKGTVTASDIKQFEDMYKTYKALDGDGYADRLKDAIDKLSLNVVA